MSLFFYLCYAQNKWRLQPTSQELWPVKQMILCIAYSCDINMILQNKVKPIYNKRKVGG